MEAPATLADAIAASAADLGMPSPQPTPPPTAPDPQAAPEPVPQPSGPKSPLDSIPDLTQPEPEATPAPEPEKPKSPQAAKWDELKSKATELDQLKPELETLRKQLEELKAKPQLPPETEQELEQLRRERFAREVESSPEWQEAVRTPWESVRQDFQNIAEFYGVDFKELVTAADDVNPLRRGAAIRQFLEGSEKEVTPEVLSIALGAAQQLHGIYAKQSELRAQSQDVMQDIETKRSLETEKQRSERDSAFSKSRDEIFTQISSKMPDIFKNQEFADAVKKATASDDPREQAYQAIAATALPEVAKQLAAARAEIAKLTKSIAARSAAQPGIGNTPPDAPQQQGLSLADAMRASGFRA